MKSSTARLSRILRPWLKLAVIGSVSLMLLGMTICFVRHPGYLFSGAGLSVLAAPGLAKVGVWKVLTAAARSDGQAIALLGLMGLMVTPVVTVLIATVFYARARDWTYTAISGAVLLLLLLSALLGRASG